VIISPLKGTWPFIWKFWIPFNKEYFKSSLIEICLLILEKILKKISVFFLFCYDLPLGRGVALHLIDFEFPIKAFKQGWIVRIFIKIRPVILEKIFKWFYPIFVIRGPGPLFE
jgi:hypothetical protein